nr:acylneuraminate cytidylyltransferase family protein [Odoribacter splanchnicus]
MNKYVAVIPARGGSKRFPGKNIYLFNGKPLITYSIEYAQKCGAVSHVYVSTESFDIKKIAGEYGAEILERPEELAGDYVTTAAVLQQIAGVLKANGASFDYLVLLQPTNPLRPKYLLTEAIEIMETGRYDSLMCVSRSDKKLGKIADDKFIPWNYEYGQRSQDMEPLYYENGLLYISSGELLQEGKIIGERMYPLITDHVFGKIDIDTKEDLLYAEYILKHYKYE